MVVTTIYVTRHGFRGNWTVDPDTGTYYTNVPSPTNIPSDPPLAAKGVQQAEQLARALSVICDPPITRIYSSPFYRCLQTLQPFVAKSGLEIRGDNGLGEWYGCARFTHPSPATPALLNSLYPSYKIDWSPSIIPSSSGETVFQLHDRCAYAVSSVISHEDVEDVSSKAGGDNGKQERAILICTHAASIIAIGRALTGQMPRDIAEEDFKTYTCGISKFVRRSVLLTGEKERAEKWEVGKEIPKVDWRDGKGVAGGWDCVMNGDCRHLDDGEERGWHFHGDEVFDDTDTTSNEEDRGDVLNVSNGKAVLPAKL